MRLAALAVIGTLCLLLVGGCASGLPTSASCDAASCVATTTAIGLNLQVHPSEHFLLVSSLSGPAATETGRFLDQVHQRFFDSFTRAGFAPRPLSDKLVCVCLDSYSQLDAYGRQADGAEVSWMDAFYSQHTNRVAVVRAGNRQAAPAVANRPSGSSAKIAAISNAVGAQSSAPSLNLRTITHEMAHQLAFNSGLQRRGASYPFWLTEGLATNFEADFSGAFGLEQGDTCHRCRLVEAKAARRLVPLGQFVGATDLPAGCSADTTRSEYAQAWGLFHFLMQNHPRELRQYMAALTGTWFEQSPDALRRQFTAHFGPLSSLEAEYLRFIDCSPRVASKTGR